MNAYCKRLGRDPMSVRFLYDGERIQENQTPAEVNFDYGED
jgi:hypothetical protein